MNEEPTTEEVEVTDSAKKEAKRMVSAYEDRPTAVLPGSHNTVTGTAINEWLDDEGKPKYGNTDQETDPKPD
ncbi:hypothetical protein [[Mycobacterium] wendilense]|uniref:Uncharacterized protein n=1 Tax=[Mycobacterium] wendilense TaxID=3064284 RepID=A0ABM9MB44_9MYCO|nr:hypothetical protein [Mycolicibacterium sp. MU0050]CAJ1580884.1 hypothetical protein MU0050_001257 [Mycolicibacterium sp. MU0050]